LKWSSGPEHRVIKGKEMVMKEKEMDIKDEEMALEEIMNK